MAEERWRTVALPPPSAIATGERSLVNPRSRLHHQPTWLDLGNMLVSSLSPVISLSVRYGWLEHLLYFCIADAWVLLTSGPICQSVYSLISYLFSQI